MNPQRTVIAEAEEKGKSVDGAGEIKGRRKRVRLMTITKQRKGDQGRREGTRKRGDRRNSRKELRYKKR